MKTTERTLPLLCLPASSSSLRKGLAVAGLLVAGLSQVSRAQIQVPIATQAVSQRPLPVDRTAGDETAVAEVGPAPIVSAAGISTSVATEVAPAGGTLDLPDSPDTVAGGEQAPGASGGSGPDVPSKRILGIVPNYRAVGVGAKLPPQTVKDKFSTALSDTIDPASFALSALVAAYDYGRGATPEFGSGGVAFGRYYWHALADQQIENISVEFLVPALTHEDTRYYTLGTGGFRKRLGYSLSRVVVTRSDSGKKTVNLGEILGAGLASGVSSRYYPPSKRDAGSVLDSYALNIGIDAASFVLREFDADLGRALSRKKHN